MAINEIVERIIAINHAWKLAREKYGAQNPITLSLREQKSSWQANLIRSFPAEVFLKEASDSASHEERLLSVRLRKPLQIASGLKSDAEHLPVRLANVLFTEKELKKYIVKEL